MKLLPAALLIGALILLYPSGAEGSVTDSAPPSDERMHWPLASPRVNSGYGMRVHPISGKWSMHTGLDLPAAQGTPVLAALSGVVIFAGVYGGYGNRLVLDHGDGLKTTYNHQFNFNVSLGEEVSRGDVIGFVGSTGNSTGNHLHFEVVLDGATVDPMPYLP